MIFRVSYLWMRVMLRMMQLCKRSGFPCNSSECFLILDVPIIPNTTDWLDNLLSGTIVLSWHGLCEDRVYLHRRYLFERRTSYNKGWLALDRRNPCFESSIQDRLLVNFAKCFDCDLIQLVRWFRTYSSLRQINSSLHHLWTTLLEVWCHAQQPRDFWSHSHLSGEDLETCTWDGDNWPFPLPVDTLDEPFPRGPSYVRRDRIWTFSVRMRVVHSPSRIYTGFFHK